MIIRLISLALVQQFPFFHAHHFSFGHVKEVLRNPVYPMLNAFLSLLVSHMTNFKLTLQLTETLPQP